MNGNIIRVAHCYCQRVQMNVVYTLNQSLANFLLPHCLLCYGFNCVSKYNSFFVMSGNYVKIVSFLCLSKNYFVI